MFLIVLLLGLLAESYVRPGRHDPLHLRQHTTHVVSSSYSDPPSQTNLTAHNKFCASAGKRAQTPPDHQGSFINHYRMSPEPPQLLGSYGLPATAGVAPGPAQSTRWHPGAPAGPVRGSGSASAQSTCRCFGGLRIQRGAASPRDGSYCWSKGGVV